MPTMANAPEEVRALMEEVIDEYFAESLRPCEPPLNIALLFSSGLKKAGFPLSWVAKVTNEEERATAGPEAYDCRIILDLDSWTNRKDRSRRGVLADALYSLEPQGKVERPQYEKAFFRCDLDTHARPILKLKKPDYHEIGYIQVAAWFGEDSCEVRNHRAVGEMLGQLPLDFDEPAAAHPASRERPPVTYGATTPRAPISREEFDRATGKTSAWDAPPVGPISAALRALMPDVTKADEPDVDTDAEVLAGLAEVEQACKAIEDSAEGLAKLNPPDLEYPAELRMALPITFLECSRGILAALWTKAEIATVGELEDCLEDSSDPAYTTLANVAGLGREDADTLLTALDRLADSYAAETAAAKPAELAAILPAAPAEVVEETPAGAIIPLNRLLEEESEADAANAHYASLDAEAKPKKPRKPKAKAPVEADPLEDLFIYWSGHNPVYALRAPSLAIAIEWVRKNHPKDAKADVKPDLDGTAARRHLTLMGDLRAPKHTVPTSPPVAPAPPAGFVGSEVKEVFRCNRCNQLRPCLIHPCPACECPEYGIVEVPKADADRLAEIHAKPAKKPRRKKELVAS